MNYSANQKFITNHQGDTLETRLNNILTDTQYFDILVGFFRLSGFKKIFHNLENVEKIRISVGINLDKQTYDYLGFTKQTEFDYFNDEVVKESNEN